MPDDQVLTSPLKSSYFPHDLSCLQSWESGNLGSHGLQLVSCRFGCCSWFWWTLGIRCLCSELSSYSATQILSCGPDFDCLLIKRQANNKKCSKLVSLIFIVPPVPRLQCYLSSNYIFYLSVGCYLLYGCQICCLSGALSTSLPVVVALSIVRGLWVVKLHFLGLSYWSKRKCNPLNTRKNL